MKKNESMAFAQYLSVILLTKEGAITNPNIAAIVSPIELI